MLDHDDLLSEEQAHPEFIEELQAMYQMRPQTEQLFERVQERLAQQARRLPGPVQAKGQTLLPQSETLVSSAPPLAWARTLRSRRFMALAAVLSIVLVGIVVMTFSALFHPGGTFRLVLVPAEQASPAQLALTSTILRQRFSAFGLQGVNVQLTAANGHAEILVDLPHFGGNETLVTHTLVERDVLEFWDTGPYQLKEGAMLDPAQYTRYNPAGQPRFTGQDLDTSKIDEERNSTGQFGISFAMKSSSSQQFYAFTRQHIASYLTITLDKKVLVSGMIQAGINGMGSIDGSFTQQQAEALAAALKSGSLPIALQQQS